MTPPGSERHRLTPTRACTRGRCFVFLFALFLHRFLAGKCPGPHITTMCATTPRQPLSPRRTAMNTSSCPVLLSCPAPPCQPPLSPPGTWLPNRDRSRAAERRWDQRELSPSRERATPPSPWPPTKATPRLSRNEHQARPWWWKQFNLFKEPNSTKTGAGPAEGGPGGREGACAWICRARGLQP